MKNATNKTNRVTKYAYVKVTGKGFEFWNNYKCVCIINDIDRIEAYCKAFIEKPIRWDFTQF